MFTHNRKAQAAGAAVLLAIIAGLLVMFILFIPPADRAELLGEGGSTTGTSSGSTSGSTLGTSAVPEKTLLISNPGKLDYIAQKEIEHPLPITSVFTKTEPKLIGEKPTAYAKNGAFTEETSDLTFFVPDLKNTNNLLLHFNIKAVEGRILVSLNDELIYEKDGKVGNLEPIVLPKALIKQSNKLSIGVSSPGAVFWKTNELSMESVKILADVTNIEAQTAKNIFLISNAEKQNMKSVVLRFQPHCNFDTVGKLQVTINAKEIYHGIPDCDLPMVPIEFGPDVLNVGENQVVLSTEKGTYELSNFFIRSELLDIEYPTYYFEISEEQYTAVTKGNRRIRLSMDFVDVTATKRGNIIYNGHLRNFDTKEVSYAIDVSDDIVRGNNALKISPKMMLEIRELKVELLK
ncbi:hypothetical protein COV12_03775 [Candidatus Woesearchaeota archaeon CG10_big_fil_rev_8_21_14_0_10_32_24]|nr:MAG: hypothetical protein COV12_03775 [Candidatus Woesearchaeota archaeon CG10_big_fil_rev_8_21_14_0_10_32_24]